MIPKDSQFNSSLDYGFTINLNLITFQGIDVKNEIFGYYVRNCDISKEDLSAVKDIKDL